MLIFRYSLLLVLSLTSFCGSGTAGIEVPVTQFDQARSGEFQSWVDRRDLLVMHHPWVPSATRGSCEATATVSLPSNLIPPIRLSLYQSDDYFNDFWRAKNDSWLGGDGFYGHRFKQVWVNDRLLWESDVADANAPQASANLDLEIPTEALEDGPFTVSLRVVDKVSSWVELASDTQHISTTETAAEKPGDPAKFWTHVYWGDVQILSGSEKADVGLPPVQRRLRDQLKAQAGRPTEKPSIQPSHPFRLVCSSPLPKGGYPVRCGIPMPRFLEEEASHYRISQESGWVVHSQIENFTHPVDGWRKWVAVEFVARPGMEETEMKFQSFGAPEQGPPIFTRPTESPEGIQFFPGGSSHFKLCQGEPNLFFASREVRFDPEHTDQLSELPLIQIEGPVTGIRSGYPDRVETLAWESEPLIVDSPRWMVIDQGKQHHFLSLRGIEGVEETRFKIESTDAGMTVTLLPYYVDGKAEDYPATAGEKKTFELLYCTFEGSDPKEDYPRLADNFNQPPLLINTEFLGESEVWGKGLPPSGETGKVLTEFLQKNYPDPLGASFQWGKTLRDYGDIIYQGTDSWRNGYYDVRQGFAAAYLISGSREWADALDRTVRHYLDVDTIHWSEAHPDHVGLPHGYGINHTSMDPWNPITRANGVFAAAHLWANSEYYDAALKMAEQVARTGRAVGAVSVRDHAGILMTLATAYRETGDPLFKEAGKKLIEDIAENRVDPRRGTYPEVHGNWNYRGNVPWMVAQLMEPLYIFYEATGDLQAASLMVGLADSILAENQTRGVPGDIHGYSHNPHFTKNSGYHVLIAPCLFYAYELTGDESFKEAGQAAWEQTVREGTINSVINCFWNTPALLYYLREIEQSPSKADTGGQ